MNYLVFDIECCDGRHICEFGYVLADAAFRVLERGVMTIAPEKPFDLGGEIFVISREERGGNVYHKISVLPQWQFDKILHSM